MRFRGLFLWLLCNGGRVFYKDGANFGKGSQKSEKVTIKPIDTYKEVAKVAKSNSSVTFSTST